MLKKREVLIAIVCISNISPTPVQKRCMIFYFQCPLFIPITAESRSCRQDALDQQVFDKHLLRRFIVHYNNQDAHIDICERERKTSPITEATFAFQSWICPPSQLRQLKVDIKGEDILALCHLARNSRLAF